MYGFSSFEDFRSWVQDYVCLGCLSTFRYDNGRDPETLDDWLTYGCGEEIRIQFDDGDIDWEAKMSLPDSYLERVK